MAVAPTGAIYKALKFDNVSSRTYGVYITGEAVYNAPARDVEMITIPGRSGAFALDNGRFENIEVSYPAGIFADTEADFRQAISDFRNFLCSRKGYVRLTDEYNPDEYRMAVYKSGLDVSPAQLRAGEFEITFECKPQRYLTSGETKSAITSGGTLTNPTLFESGPLFEVKGYGTIDFNGYEIELISGDYGNILIADNQKFNKTGYEVTIPSEYFNSGDSIVVSGVRARTGAAFVQGTPGAQYFFHYPPPAVPPQPVDSNADVSSVYTTSPSGALYGNGGYYTGSTFEDITFTMGTASSVSDTITITGLNVSRYNSGSIVTVESIDTTTVITISYDGSQTITFTATFSATGTTGPTLTFSDFGSSNNPSVIGSITVYSTLTYLGNPTYIDCDLGEAYKIENNTVISLNSYIDLGSDLPKLGPGANTITYDNTITELKVTPRWWKV